MENVPNQEWRKLFGTYGMQAMDEPELEQDPPPDVVDMADWLWSMYSALRTRGFRSDQAMEITVEMISTFGGRKE